MHMKLNINFQHVYQVHINFKEKSYNFALLKCLIELYNYSSLRRPLNIVISCKVA